MYCSVCGSESSPGLKYCKSCGARIVKDNSEVRNSIAKTFAMASMLTGVFGMITIAIIVKELIGHGFDLGPIFAMTALLLASLIALEFFIIRQILKLTGISDERRTEKEESAFTPRFQKPAVTAQLEEHREPASVVEDTTRNLTGVTANRD
jgi:hypothetical protein